MKNSRSGTKSYRYGDLQIEEMPYFLYNVTFYKVYKNRFNLLESKYYKSNKLLNVKEYKVIKRFNKFTIDCLITLIGAPIEFINENYLKEFELKNERKKNRVHR